MTPHRHWLRNYKPLQIPIKLADNTIVYSAGVGSVVFKPVIKGREVRAVEFQRVLHVPRLRNNLLSCLYLTRKKGFQIHIYSDSMHFIYGGKSIFIASIDDNNAAYLDGVTEASLEHAQLSATLPLDLNLWHRRLAHHSYADVQKMIKEDLVTGLVLESKQQPDPICEPCLAGKMHANSFPSSLQRATQPLELIHSDIHGPLPVRTHSGYRYWITFIDDYTRFRVVLLLKEKSEAFDAFKRFKAYAENHLNVKIKALQDDKGGEYMSHAFIKYTDDAGIVRRHTTRNRPQQNGVAERANRVMQDDCSAMLAEAKLPLSFWGECLASMVHVWNCLPTSAVKGATPFELWFKRKPDVSHLRVWGCTAYVHIQKDQRSALGPHMQKCVFIGYPDGYKGWKFYNPTTKKTIISERADFDERYFPGLKHTSSIHPPAAAVAPESVPVPDFGGDNDPAPVDAAPVPNPLQVPVAPPPNAPTVAQSPSPSPAPSAPTASPDPAPQTSNDDRPIALRRTPRNVRPPTNWWVIREPTPAVKEESSEDELDVIDADADFVEVQFAGLSAGADPHTFKQAMSGPDAKHWYDAANQEIMALVGNHTWDIVELPPGKKVIGSGWVFKIKRNADGSIERYKGRVVAKGYSQRPGFDYTEVFAPTFRLASLRLILALAAIEDLELRSVDISSAFLNGDLDEEIYMKQPEGFHEGGPSHVCRLRRPIYGLKQAPRQWNKKLRATLESMSFKCLYSDRSVYLYVKDDVRIIVPVFVDDMTIATKSVAAADNVVKQLSQHFKLRDLGPTTFLLGIEITRDRSERSLSLCQHQYIIDMLERFNLSDCKPVKTPMTPGLVLTKEMGAQSQEDIEFMHNVPYLSAVGALMYLAITTRPDIQFAVSFLARFNSNPGPAHWNAVKHVFRYLQGSKHFKLTYKPDSAQKMFVTYSDAAHADCRNTGRSTGGYVVKVGTGAISWSSKLQGIVTLSTTEAEYIAAVEAGKEILWMRNILTEFGYTIDMPSTLYIDNQSSLSVTKNPEHHGRMKHLDLRFYWLRDTVETGIITTEYMPTKLMVADVLTKALTIPQLVWCRQMMGVHGVVESDDAATESA
ncbi:hypothetical protein AcV5_010529 [Taiwanofungus camphoratus]|nr:hypothetical protein AcV5_010529 [Antrodia cinnamomea]